MNKIIKNLTESQKVAITYNKGPLLVLAGPGAGKTKVLTTRIAYILDKTKSEKFKILALTFTNKAAKEMRERVEDLVGEEVKRTYIGTFHSFCHELLRSYGEYIDLNPDFMIYDNHDDLITLLIEAVKRRVQEEIEGKELPFLIEKYENVRVIESTIPGFYYAYNKFKNKLIGPADLPMDRYSVDFKFIFQLYQQALKEANVLDFSDLLFYTHRLLRDNSYIANHLRTIYRHVLIDEGQDTNKAQFELIKLLCGKSYPNLFIVADEDQLIFEWNDAKFEYLVELKNYYQMEVIQLYESFRCPSQVLEVANRLISHNNLRIRGKKPIVSQKNDKKEEAIELNMFETQIEEAEFVTKKINELLDGFNWEDRSENNLENYKVCVIARNRYVITEMIKKLENIGIPYYVPMLQEKFVTKDMNFVINMIKLKHNENDKVTFYKICEYLGINYEEILYGQRERSLFEIVIEKLKRKNTELASALEKGISQTGISLSEYFDGIFNAVSGIDQGEENDELLDDLKFFRDVYQDFKREHPLSENLGEFLSYLALASRKEGKGVAILTGHASKGLEFENVFIISLNQGIWPDYRAVNKAKKGKERELEEERRNCFVAVTRTKKKLFLSYVEFKMTRSRNLQPVEPSQFLFEMGLLDKD